MRQFSYGRGHSDRLRTTPRWRLSPLCRAILLCATLPCANADAELFFNPQFLSNDASVVADLSRFEQGKGQPPGVYRVDVYLNREYVAARDITFNALTPAGAGGGEHQDGRRADDSGLAPCITRELLDTLNVDIKAFPQIDAMSGEQCVPLTRAIPEAGTTFDFELQRLDISLPQAALATRARGYIPPERWDEGIPAALLNYDFTGSNSSGDDSSNSYFLNLNSGLNWESWRLRDYSTWNYYSYQERRTSDWQHVSTYLQRTIIPLKSELTLGDSTTQSDVFDSLGFRGVQLASDDNMLPDSLRGFAPTLRGVARSNARVTVRQNGYVIYQTYVAPGAFTISDLYPTSSSGDLVMTVTESDNSTSTLTIPYSAVPVLQREGRVKYALTAGQYRSNYSQQDKPEFGQGTLIWGLPEGVTLYGGMQMSNDYQSAAIGAGKNMGDWGAFSADVTQAYSTLADGSDHQGQSLRFLYARSLNALGTNFQLLGYRYSTEGFYTLDETSYKRMSGYSIDTLNVRPVYQDYYDLNHTKKGRVQVNITQRLGQNGTLFFTGSRQDYWHSNQTSDLWQIGYSHSWAGISCNLNYSYNKSLGSAEADRLLALNVSLPLSQWLTGGGRKADITRSSNASYLTYTANTDTHGRTMQQAGVSGTLLPGNNLGYSVQQGYGGQGIGYSGNANLNYQGTYGNSNIGYNYSEGYRQVHYGLSGGAAAHADGITLSQPLSDTNVLVKAPGAGGVRLENATGVSTDWRGYAIVPYATTYRQNRIALDINTLDNRTEIDNAVVNVVPTHGALVRASFDARVGARALLTLRQRNGKAVPFGAEVRRVDSSNTGIVGDDGQVFLSGLASQGVLNVEWGRSAAQQCTINYALPAGSDDKPVSYAKAECL